LAVGFGFHCGGTRKVNRCKCSQRRRIVVSHMTRVEESTPVASCEMSSEDPNSNLARRGRVERPGFGSRTRAFECYWRKAIAICVICFFVPCDAWYSSPFSNAWQLSGALDRCNSNGMGGTYENCDDYNGVHISDWDVSNVHDMNGVFYNGCWNYCISTTNFNADISRWDVSSVTSMSYMFSSAQSFNGDISRWDVSSVTYMNSMFSYASSFDGDLSNWNTANANGNAYSMFYGATAWQNSHVYVHTSGSSSDGPPDRWCRTGSHCPFPADGQALKEAVASCLIATPDGNCDCSQSWINCRHGLSQPMSEWDVSRVTDMSQLFQHDRWDYNYYYTINTQSFNVDLSTWNTHAVTSMSYMFQNAHNFNADISNWNTQSLAHMEKMFENAHSFDADITKWTCDAYESQRTRSQVEDMFKGADAWHASYVNTHTGYFDLNLGPPNMWVPVDEYKGDSFFAKDKRVQILIAFVAVLGAGLLGVVVFLIVRCATHRKRTAKKVTTQFRIAHAHAHAGHQHNFGMTPMPPGAPVLPGRSPIVVTLPATPLPAQQQTEESQQV